MENAWGHLGAAMHTLHHVHMYYLSSPLKFPLQIPHVHKCSLPCKYYMYVNPARFNVHTDLYLHATLFCFAGSSFIWNNIRGSAVMYV